MISGCGGLVIVKVGLMREKGFLGLDFKCGVFGIEESD
jgi:hypothetical protein